MSDFWVAIVATALSIRSLAEHRPTSGFPDDPRPPGQIDASKRHLLLRCQKLFGRPRLYLRIWRGWTTDVTWAIDIIRKELDVSMALTGVKSVPKLGRHNLVR